MRIWNAASGNEECVSKLNPKQDLLASVAWMPDGSEVAFRASDGNIRRIATINGQHLENWSSPKGLGGSIAFSHDGSLIIKSSEQTILVCDTSTQSLIHELKGHTEPIVKVVFHPLGTIIASSSNDHTIRLWDTATGEHLRTLRGHGGTPLGLAFSPDGARLASSSTDQTVKLWDVATGLELQSLTGHGFWVRDVAFSADGQHLASAGYDSSVRIWHAPLHATEWATAREAAALVRHLATRFPARESVGSAISVDETISASVRAAASHQAEEFLYYWNPMVDGHRAAERGNWEEAIRDFELAIALAPNEVMLWHFLAMASIAADRLDIYQRACNELLQRVSPTATESDLFWTMKTWLAAPHESVQHASIQPIVVAYIQRFPESGKLPFLYGLRQGKILPQKVAGLAHSDNPEDLYTLAISSVKAGDTADALSAYQRGDHLSRKGPKDVKLWYVDIYRETLRREVEDLLGARKPSDSAALANPTVKIASSSSSGLEDESRVWAPSDATE